MGNKTVDKTIQVKISNREINQSDRNDEGLQQLANGTGGHYTVYKDQDSNSANETEFSSRLRNVQPRKIETRSTLTNDQRFKKRLMYWLLGLASLYLCSGWTIRRLFQLA